MAAVAKIMREGQDDTLPQMLIYMAVTTDLVSR